MSGTSRRLRYLQCVYCQLLAELNATATARVAEYAYYPGTDRPMTLITGATTPALTRYFVQDPLGNVLGVVRDTFLHQTITYDEWGQQLQVTGARASARPTPVGLDLLRPVILVFDMIQPTRRLAELEARYGREAFRDWSYADALELFAALWAEARALQGGTQVDWEADLAPDLAVARAVNGLPPRA